MRQGVGSIKNTNTRPIVQEKLVFCVMTYTLFMSCGRQLTLGEELYTQMDFFVQSILTNRYIHCRVVIGIIKSLSSAEYGIKRIFLNFAFYSELSIF